MHTLVSTAKWKCGMTSTPSSWCTNFFHQWHVLSEKQLGALVWSNVLRDLKTRLWHACIPIQTRSSSRRNVPCVAILRRRIALEPKLIPIPRRAKVGAGRVNPQAIATTSRAINFGLRFMFCCLHVNTAHVMTCQGSCAWPMAVWHAWSMIEIEPLNWTIEIDDARGERQQNLRALARGSPSIT